MIRSIAKAMAATVIIKRASVSVNAARKFSRGGVDVALTLIRKRPVQVFLMWRDV